MNPGIVNVCFMHAIKHHGVPKKLVEIEYDNATPIEAEVPIITWSKKQFLTESLWDLTGRTTQNGVYETLKPHALAHLVNTQEYLKYIWPMQNYPMGAIVAHDEIMSLGSKYSIPAQFIYAINQPTLNFLMTKLAKKQIISEDDLVFADNTKVNIIGQDSIGIILSYSNKKIIYSNTMHHANFLGTNATLMQVAIGVLAGLKEILQRNVPHGINYPENLIIDSAFDTISNHMKIEQKIIHHQPRAQVKKTITKNTINLPLSIIN